MGDVAPVQEKKTGLVFNRTFMPELSFGDSWDPTTDELCVFYLARCNEGYEPILRFLKAWSRHPFGCPHKLIFIAKGWETDTGLSGIPTNMLQDVCRIHHVPDTGLDVDTYWRVGREYGAAYSLFLNTFSEPLVDNWGYLMMAHAGRRRLIGATGNWESHSIGSRPFQQLFKYGVLGLPWTLVVALRAFRHWPVYPNPALRTNAFMVPLELLHTLPVPIGRKRNLWVFESGRRGLSRKAISLGYELLVVGKDGLGYKPQDWYRSCTFRMGEQSNLLVADNRTRDYENADPSRRRELEILSWGHMKASIERWE
jgi:hypothetical protein